MVIVMRRWLTWIATTLAAVAFCGHDRDVGDLGDHGDRGEPVPVDLAILPQRRDGRRINAPDFHDSTTETFTQTRQDHRACASFRQ